ncbi:DNA-processing protein DprA [Coralliovum pocilloporae]|uniref:DNA-processing protein DprA n=1 Tax=Coralliovum pocilloporae TaxID=3066369 RepID=UPI0033072343
MLDLRPPTHPARRQLTETQRLNWLRLIRSENVGPTTFRELVNHFGSAAAALDALPELSRRGGSKKQIRVCPQELAERELTHADRCGARFVAWREPGYPYLLASLDVPPPLLAIRGQSDMADRPSLAIVGSRNASISGSKLTDRFARELGEQGLVIVSGLARGIDTTAHKAALEHGTIAVLAGGLDKLYPPENRALFDAIAERGLVISEMPFGWTARARDFPRRNRIVSGIAYGVLVVEAARRSGTLITARLAGEQGRLVFAIPGSPLDPRAEGTNNLIRSGATLVAEPNHIVTDVMPLLGRPVDDRMLIAEEPDYTSPIDTDLPETDRQALIAALGPTPVSVDDIIDHTGLDARTVQILLLELDLAGRLERHGSQLVSLIL